MSDHQPPDTLVGDTFERIDIDGIPTFTSAPGVRYTGALMFRVGRADETLRHTGMTHLVEHLAMYAIGLGKPYAFNAQVQGLYTMFHATGTPEEVGGHLTRVAQALGDLPMARLQDEARVLRVEATSHATSPVEQLLWLRYGATGPGVMQYSEVELLKPDADAVRAWAAERFTSGNAVMWFTGPPPPGLRVPLPPGRRWAPPALKPIAHLKPPSWAVGPPGLIGLSFVRPRDEWLSITIKIAAENISAKLRHERGLTYLVGGDFMELERDTGHAALFATCLPEHAQAVRDGMLDTLEKLARDGASDEELARARGEWRRGWSDPESLFPTLASNAANELTGYPRRTNAQLVEEMERLDGAEIGRRLTRALETVLLFAPEGVPPPGRSFTPHRVRVFETKGRTFRLRTSLFPWSKGPRLIVGRDGVSLVQSRGAGFPYGVSFDACAVAIEHGNGALEIVGEDGVAILVEPDRWREGDAAVRALLAAVPPDRVVRVGRDGHRP